METRRSFIGKSLAVTAIISQFSPSLEATRLDLVRLRSPMDVTGKPTPDYLKVGITGVEYVRAGDHHINKSMRCWLDGVEVTMRASECDTKAGWVRMYERGLDGNFVIRYPKDLALSEGIHSVEHIHFGAVRLEIL